MMFMRPFESNRACLRWFCSGGPAPLKICNKLRYDCWKDEY